MEISKNYDFSDLMDEVWGSAKGLWKWFLNMT